MNKHVYNTLRTILNRAYFITVIDSVFCLGIPTIIFDWCEIIGSYSTPDTVVRDRRTN